MAEQLPSKRELRQRWLDHGISATEDEARELVRGGIYAGHDPIRDLARLSAYRVGRAAGVKAQRHG